MSCVSTFDLSSAGLSTGDPRAAPHLSGQQRRLHPLLHLQNSQQLPQEVPVPAVHRCVCVVMLKPLSNSSSTFTCFVDGVENNNTVFIHRLFPASASSTLI